MPRGSGTEEKGTRRDELDLDSHLSFPSTRSPSSSPPARLFASFSFSFTPCLFLPHTHSHFSHSPLCKESLVLLRRPRRALTQSDYYRNKTANNPLRGWRRRNSMLVSLAWAQTVVHARPLHLLFIRTEMRTIALRSIPAYDHDSKSVRSLPLY